jgi:hypothetical protein
MQNLNTLYPLVCLFPVAKIIVCYSYDMGSVSLRAVLLLTVPKIFVTSLLFINILYCATL